MELTPFEVAKKQIDVVAEEMGLDPNVTKYLKRTAQEEQIRHYIASLKGRYKPENIVTVEVSSGFQLAHSQLNCQRYLKRKCIKMQMLI